MGGDEPLTLCFMKSRWTLEEDLGLMDQRDKGLPEAWKDLDSWLPRPLFPFSRALTSVYNFTFVSGTVD